MFNFLALMLCSSKLTYKSMFYLHLTNYKCRRLVVEYGPMVSALKRPIDEDLLQAFIQTPLFEQFVFPLYDVKT